MLGSRRTTLGGLDADQRCTVRRPPHGQQERLGCVDTLDRSEGDRAGLALRRGGRRRRVPGGPGGLSMGHQAVPQLRPAAQEIGGRLRQLRSAAATQGLC